MNAKVILKIVLGVSLSVQQGLAMCGVSSESESSATEAERYCRSVANPSKSTKELIFADISRNKKPAWRRFASRASLAKSFEDQIPPDTVALVHLREGRIAEANFTLQSESADWTKSSNHCFRSDGTLAVLRSTLKTFHGNVTQEVLSIYGKSGALIKQEISYFDLQTREQLAAPPSDFQEEETPVYMRARELPFFKLAGDKGMTRGTTREIKGDSQSP